MDSFASESPGPRLLFKDGTWTSKPQCNTRLGHFPWSSNPGKQGGIHWHFFPLPSDFDTPQGDRLQIDVRDDLDNEDLDLVTSVVRPLSFLDTFGTLICLLPSIGMVSYRRTPTMPMVAILSTSAPLYQTKAFCITSRSQTKRYFSLGHVCRISTGSRPWFQGTFWYHSHFEAQYCDGLRGALIIDDPDDPQQDLYDIDNGEKDFWKIPVHGPKISSDDTIITLADWYHTISTEAGLTP